MILSILYVLNKCITECDKATHLSFCFFPFPLVTASIDDGVSMFIQLQTMATGEGFDLDEVYIVRTIMILCNIPFLNRAL